MKSVMTIYNNEIMTLNEAKELRTQESIKFKEEEQRIHDERMHTDLNYALCWIDKQINELNKRLKAIEKNTINTYTKLWEQEHSIDYLE